MANTIDIDVKHDGAHGYDYTISDKGVLLGKGWVRLQTHVAAIRLVRSMADLLQSERVVEELENLTGRAR